MNLLAAVDFSPVSERVLEVARELAWDEGARVLLLHVAEPDPAFVGYEAGPQVVRDQVAEEFRGQRKALQEWPTGCAARAWRPRRWWFRAP
jgi:nucleotide-binding universal stress UspA family protein